MEQLRVDALSPTEIAKKVAEVAKGKSGLDLFRMFMLGILGGAFVAFGAQLYTLVIHDSSLSLGLTKLVGGIAFSLGLILIVLAGAELFTGNTLMVIAFAQRMINTRNLFRSWGIIYGANFAGALAIVFLMYYTEQWGINNSMVGGEALLIANTKVNLAFHTAFVRAILANVLVCLAVWLCFGARSTVDKVFAVIFPVTAFVAAGFEHSIANMYFVPMGIWLKGQPSVLAAAEKMSGAGLALQNLTWSGFIVRNLIPVTIGNVVGGSILVGLVYWSIYVREFTWRGLFRLIQIGFELIFFVRPRRLSRADIAMSLSGFYAVLSRRRPRGRPLPRDLSGMGIDQEKEEQKD
ncbi:formate/nitrite transporter family protein [Chloroflexota bacterium]